MNDPATSLSFRAEQLLRTFARCPAVTSEHLEAVRDAIASSATLAREIDIAFGSGTLRHLGVLDPGSHASGEYHPDRAMILLKLDLLSSPGEATFILGHEVQHARNGWTTLRTYGRFHADIKQAASGSVDYTRAIDHLVQECRRDEASANLAGWNALVDRVRSQFRRPQLKHVVQAAPRRATDFVMGRGSRTRFFPSLASTDGLTLALTPANIETMARKYFDKPARGTALGTRGTSDYTNYYAAWAIGQIAACHVASSPDRPMRVDAARLGLSRKVMEENGLDLHGVGRQAYIDESTQPPTNEFFHDTMSTNTYVPPGAQDLGCGQIEATVALRLASAGFAHPATDSIRATSRCVSLPVRTRIKCLEGRTLQPSPRLGWPLGQIDFVVNE